MVINTKSGGKDMNYGYYSSPVGRLLLTCDAAALTGLWIDREAPESWGKEQKTQVLEQSMRWLEAYFQGKPQKIGFPLAPEGTAFQKQVWQLLLDIPWGQTRTYGDIAREMADRMGKKVMSAQAVGQAVGSNPIAIVIPCHRVVGKNGSLTGYAGGLEKKRWLLEWEGKRITGADGRSAKVTG